MCKERVFLGCALLLAACARPEPITTEDFITFREINFADAGQMAWAKKEAQAHCAQFGKRAVLTNTRPGDRMVTYGCG